MELLTQIAPLRSSHFYSMNARVSAQESGGLIYVNEQTPGITRKKKGKGFTYFDPEGHPLHDKKILQRIRKLVVPPAYSDVWICTSLRGHIQATGRDSRGRKQYKYHEKWCEIRDAHRYNHMMAFGKALPKIRRKIAEHLKLPGLPKQKILATVVQLLEKTLMRGGNNEDIEENSQATVEGAEIRFELRSESKNHRVIDIHDRRLAKIVSHCQDLSGHELFQYLDEEGHRHRICSEDVNEYLREITGREFTAKDFRTWGGTTLAILALSDVCDFNSPAEAKKNISQAIAVVAQKLGNTKAICRKCYVHPAVFEAYLEKRLVVDIHNEKEELDQNFSERKVFHLLEHWLKKEKLPLSH